ncbi:2OG-Fe(II)-dependent halogenase WelO5 family protein [Vibrio sagamiensis]|uniref:Prolyl 4-hydroxylase alpha subunit Fe(2+) 2OG dioxygenase domain-containing protein n=2 Tax=Vibrio sagamiensis TaxID=512650 RepID=A0A511QCB2_9VIBR|nr:hypothetical protein [Vibrio sagamiensis]GEM74837.1 hypothetical protein VSA01S_09490 [Vibrio sagamiensis NBRC 104589]
MKGNWIKKELCELNKENMDLLLNFKIPGIIIKNFISYDICQEVSNRLIATNFSGYDHLNNIPVQQLGLCHNQYAHADKEIYFSKCNAAEKEIKKIYKNLNINPVNKIINLLNENLDMNVGIYEEEGFGKYFAGAFRSFKGHGRLHADHAPSHIKQSWAVTELVKQLTWNIYYCIYEQKGGELIIYDTIHTDKNDHMKVDNEYYFPYEVLEREDHIKVRPNVGDLIIFNTQNFHEILGQPNGNRISQTSFMGLTKSGNLKLWS